MHSFFQSVLARIFLANFVFDFLFLLLSNCGYLQGVPDEAVSVTAKRSSENE